MYTGPNVTNDNLVFGYDTGHGVGNNDTVGRFYPGKPTTNLLSSTEAFDDTNYWARSKNSGSTPTVTANTSNNPLGGIYSSKADKVYIPDDGTYPRIAQNFTPASTNTHHFSVWIRSLSGACGIFLGIFRNSPWSLPGQTTIGSDQITAEWKRFSFSFTPADTSSHQIYMGAHDAAAHKGNTLEFWGAQIEEESDRTPYTASSRSNTTSLIDLKRTTSINVNNLSFSSTALPTFDGTNDYIELDDALNSLGSVATFEAVFKATETNNTFRVILGWGDGYNNYSGLHIGSWTGAYTDESLHVGLNSDTLQMFVRKGETFYKDNAFHHVIVTAGQNNYSIWVDGVEQTFTFKHGSQSTVFTQIVGYNSNIDSQIGSRPYPTSRGYFKGDIPVLKVYDRILSDTEIKRNYNAYKKRFNI